MYFRTILRFLILIQLKTILYILHLIVQAVINIEYIAVYNFTPQNNLLQQKQMKSGFKVVA